MVAATAGPLTHPPLRPPTPCYRGLTFAKWFYATGFLATAILTWCLRDFENGWLSKNVSSFQYCQRARLTNLCSGKQVALRISFGNFIFFAAHVIVLALLRSPDDARLGIHTGLWVWKLLLWIGALVGAFFMPAGSIQSYGEVARFGSGVFLVFQVGPPARLVLTAGHAVALLLLTCS
jgi:serine incorporator 1/3